MNSCLPAPTHSETRSVPLTARDFAAMTRPSMLRCTLCQTVVKVVKQRGLGLVCCGRDMVAASTNDN